MGVPPTRPSSTPPSGKRGEGPDEHKTKRNKDFKMPDKNKRDEKEEKKNVFDIAGAESQKQMRQEVSTQGDELKVEQANAITAKEQVTAIGRLIQNMVASMQVGTVGGKDFASINLASGRDVPEAFAGSNLTLSYVDNGLIIRFDNFQTPQQEQNALLLIENNKEQLVQMVQALQARNIQVAELNIGNRQVALPRVEPLPPPFQPEQPSGGESRRDRGGDQGRQQRPGGGPKGPTR